MIDYFLYSEAPARARFIKVFYRWNDAPEELHAAMAVRAYRPLNDAMREEYDDNPNVFYTYEVNEPILGNKGNFTVIDYED
jgi:hypothetical protein